MTILTNLEEQLLSAFRQVHSALLIGIDHHGDQMTVAAVRGQEVAEQQLAKPGYSWIAYRVFAQDGFGYVALLEYLAEEFPEVSREQYRFLSEPSYAKPCSHFLLGAGFERHQVLWSDTRKVAQFRKAHHLSAAGKNDADDARTMIAMLYHAACQPSAPVDLFEMPEFEPLSTALGGLAEEYHRLARHGVELKNRICQLVMLLFPELRRLWFRTQLLPKPGGGRYERRELALFDTLTPMRLLAAFPGARAVAAAGFEPVWAAVGGVGLKKATIRKVVELAEQSGGVDDPFETRRLQMLVEEYLALEARKQAYKDEITALLDEDPVLASLKQIPWLAPHQLATIVGAIGRADRYANVDVLKRYLNIAPRPMPQSGHLDEKERPVQVWRMPANTYEKVNGQKRLLYRAPGRQDVRKVLYLAFENLMRGQHRLPEDPFVRRYLAYKKSHQGRTRWVGRVRWKVGAKLVTTIFYCLKYRRLYDPQLAVGVAAA